MTFTEKILLFTIAAALCDEVEEMKRCIHIDSS